jgi:hypothetical protein
VGVWVVVVASGIYYFYDLPSLRIALLFPADIRFENIRGDNAWRSGWLNCVPESPCRNITFENVQALGALPFMCANVLGKAGTDVVPSAAECVKGGTYHV